MNNKKIFDAHTHFNDNYKFNDSMIGNLIKDALNENVGYFLCASFDLKSSHKAIEISKKYKNIVYAGIAIHPNDVQNFDLSVFEELDKMAQNIEVICIGETGLDYFYSKEYKKLQKTFFIEHIKLAIKHNKTLQIHIRDSVGIFDAYKDVIKILKKNLPKKVVIHCFSGDRYFAKEFLKLGCYINIGGAVTFKNAKMLQEVVEYIPLEKILVETDAPYLAPHPNRGKVNEQKFINFTVEKIAKIKNISKEAVIEQTTLNAFKIFDLD